MTSLDTLKISPVFQIFAFAIISNANISVSWAVVIDKSLPVEIIVVVVLWRNFNRDFCLCGRSERVSDKKRLNNRNHLWCGSCLSNFICHCAPEVRCLREEVEILNKYVDTMSNKISSRSEVLQDDQKFALMKVFAFCLLLFSKSDRYSLNYRKRDIELNF